MKKICGRFPPYKKEEQKMNFMDNMGKKLKQSGQNVFDKAKNMTYAKRSPQPVKGWGSSKKKRIG